MDALEKTLGTLPGKPWWEKTADEISCGRCDVSPAGMGAEPIVAPDVGLIVACRDCLPVIRRERERRRKRDEERRARR